MTELQLARGATRWLRGFAVGVVTLVFAFALANVIYSPASSTTQPGADSKVDYSVAFNVSGANNDVAQTDASAFPFISANGTWEMWLKPSSVPNDEVNHFLAKEFTAALAIFGNSNFHFSFGDGTTWISDPWVDTGIRAQVGQWQHVAFVKEGTTMRLYLNGQLAFTQSSNKVPATINQNSAQRLTIGHRAGYNGTNMFRGNIDEVKIWDSARTPEQIAQFMHARPNFSDSNLLGYWDFNESSDTTVHNRKVGAASSTHLSLRTGTNQGSAWNPTRQDVKQFSSAANGDTIITFPRTYLPGVGGWTIPEKITNVKALVVGGGGAGGYGIGGGGGGGEFYENLNLALENSSTKSVQVGAGGLLPGSFGQESKFGSIEVFGVAEEVAGFLMHQPHRQDYQAQVVVEAMVGTALQSHHVPFLVSLASKMVEA